MRALGAALSRSVLGWLKNCPRSALTDNQAAQIAIAGGGQIPHRATGSRRGEDRSMPREGYFILDSDLHLMEPYDLWERYLEGPHKANRCVR